MFCNNATELDPLRPSLLPKWADKLQLDYVTYTYRDKMLSIATLITAPILGMLCMVKIRYLHIERASLPFLYPAFLPIIILCGVSLILILVVEHFNEPKFRNSVFLKILYLLFYGSGLLSVFVLEPTHYAFEHVFAFAFSFWIAISFSEKLFMHTLQLFVADASIPDWLRWQFKRFCRPVPLRRRLFNPFIKYTWFSGYNYKHSSVGRYGVYEMHAKSRLYKKRLVLSFVGGFGFTFMVAVIHSLLSMIIGYLAVSALVFVQVYFVLSEIYSDLRKDPENQLSSFTELAWESVTRYFVNTLFVLNSWWGYNTHHNQFPGIFRSPFGGINVRRPIYGVALVAFITSSYLFMIGPIVSVHGSALSGIGPLQIVYALLLSLLVIYVPILLTFFGIISILPQIFFLFAKNWPKCLSLTDSTRLVPQIKYCKRANNTAWGNYLDYVAERQRLLDGEHAHHILMGTSALGDYPVLLPTPLPHSWLLGNTRSGKSVLMAQLITQLIANGDSVVVIDLKGDPVLFESVRIAADRMTDEFKWFTNKDGAPTYIFNPFQQSYMKTAPKGKIVEFLMRSLGFYHGKDWSKNHFTLMNFDVLHKVFDFIEERITSFKKLDFHLTRLESMKMQKRKARFNNKQKQQQWSSESKLYDTPAQKEHAQDVRTTIRALSTYKTMNYEAKDVPPEVFNNAIDMSKPFQKQCVYYFSLDTIQEQISGSNVGKLAIWSLIMAATAAKEKNKHVNLFVDEFAQVISKDLQNLLDMSASSGITAVLSNQSLGQFDDTPSMESVVRDNTDLQVTFTLKDSDERRDMEYMSGEAVYKRPSITRDDLKNTSVTHDTTDYSRGHRIQQELDARQKEVFEIGRNLEARDIYTGSRFTSNTLSATTARRNECILQYTRNTPDSFAQFDGLPIILNTHHFITIDEYENRKKTSFPSSPRYPGTIRNVVDVDVVRESSSSVQSPKDDDDPTILDAEKQNNEEDDDLDNVFASL